MDSEYWVDAGPIRSYLNAIDFDSAEVRDRTGVSKETILRLRNGQYQQCRLDTADRILIGMDGPPLILLYPVDDAEVAA